MQYKTIDTPFLAHTIEYKRNFEICFNVKSSRQVDYNYHIIIFMSKPEFEDIQSLDFFYG